MKSLFVIALLSLSISANAATTMTLFQPAFTAANDSSSSNRQQVQESRVEKTDPIICYSTTLTRAGLPIVLTKMTTTFKINIPNKDSYRVFVLAPTVSDKNGNPVYIRNEQSGYYATGKILSSDKDKFVEVGDFRVEAKYLPGKGTVLLAFNDKELATVTVTCSKIDNR